MCFCVLNNSSFINCYSLPYFTWYIALSTLYDLIFFSNFPQIIFTCKNLTTSLLFKLVTWYLEHSSVPCSISSLLIKEGWVKKNYSILFPTPSISSSEWWYNDAFFWSKMSAILPNFQEYLCENADVSNCYRVTLFVHSQLMLNVEYAPTR